MAELILLAVFYLSGLFVMLKVPHAPIVLVISGGIISMLYFYGGYWLYAQSGVSTVNRIVAGVLYSENIVACVFCFFKWGFWRFQGITGLIALAIVFVICLFNYKKEGYKEQLARCIFFLAALLVLYGYRCIF